MSHLNLEQKVELKYMMVYMERITLMVKLNLI